MTDLFQNNNNFLERLWNMSKREISKIDIATRILAI